MVNEEHVNPIYVTFRNPKFRKGIDDPEHEFLKIDVKKIIENYMMVVPREGGAPVPFILNRPQRRLYARMCKDWNEGKRLWYIILKARQMGFSTLIEAFLFVLTMFQEYMKSVIVADEEENASTIFEMSKNYYDLFRAENILPRLSHSNGRLIQTAKTHSSIRILCAGKNTGRGKAIQYLHLSEFAFWEDPETTLTALLQSVPTTGRTCIFIESTANGFNSFKKRCDKARFDENDPYTFFFFPWFEMDEYREPYNGFELTPEEEQVKEQFNLDNEQIAWRRIQIGKLSGNMDKFHQEYPATPEEAFIATGNSVFDNQVVSQRKEIVEKTPFVRGNFVYHKEHSRDGERIEITNIKFVENKFGAIKLFTKPLEGFPYVIGGDCADGGEDNFTASVIDNVSTMQVATFCRNKIDPDMYAYQLYCLGQYFNWALVGTEINKNGQVMRTLVKCGYPNLYVRQEEDDMDDSYKNKWGVKTTTLTKPIMISEFKTQFRDHPECIQDLETLEEMETFAVLKTPSGKETTGAMAGYHDDRVMCHAIALFIRNQQTTEVEIVNKTESIDEWIERTIEEDIQKKKGTFGGLW